jgi:hypothetical protein
MGGPVMAMDDLIAYVVLLSLPLWLLIEQLLFLRSNRRPRMRRPGRRTAAAPFREALRSGQR